MTRHPIHVAFVAAALASSVLAHAQPPADTASCVAAFDRAQDLKIARRLVEANEALPGCLESACPPVVRTECAKMLDEVQKATPSVVPRFVQADGEDAVNVKVTMDGKPLVERLDGRAIQVDPGPHTFVFEVLGQPSVVRKAMIAEGEKGRIIHASLVSDTPPPPPRPPPPPPREESSVHPAAWVLYGVAALGVGGFIGLGVHSLSLEDCGLPCNEDEIDDIVLFRALADVSLGIGALALGAAIWVTVASLDDEGESTASVVVAPTPGGAMPSLHISF